MRSACFGSAADVFHSSLPVLASIAIILRIESGQEKSISENRKAARQLAAAGIACRGIVVMGVRPKDGAGGGIQRNDIIGVLDRIHDAVHHQRRRFGLLRGIRLIDPLQLQVLRVVRGDLCRADYTAGSLGNRSTSASSAAPDRL